MRHAARSGHAGAAVWARFPSPLTAHALTVRPDEIRCGRSTEASEASPVASQASRVASLFRPETTESEFALNMSDIVRCQSPQVRFSSILKATFCGLRSLSNNADDVIKKKKKKKSPRTLYRGERQRLYFIPRGWDRNNEELTVEMVRFLWQRARTMSHIPPLSAKLMTRTFSSRRQLTGWRISTRPNGLKLDQRGRFRVPHPSRLAGWRVKLCSTRTSLMTRQSSLAAHSEAWPSAVYRG